MKKAKKHKLEKELAEFDIEKYIQSQPNHTWLDWEREEQVITDIEEQEENEFDREGREKE